MIINIVAGGPENLLPDLNEFTTDEVTWVGVDRGVFVLLDRGIKPEIAFGDFDSVTLDEWSYIEKTVNNLKKFRPEKDETDMELALDWALKQNAREIRIFGATGGRVDHLMANIQLLYTPLLTGNQAAIVLIDRQNIMFMKGPGSYKIKKILNKKYISFLPISLHVKGISLEGFKYPLQNRHISTGSTLCISNELINDYGTFSFTEGILLVIRSDDE